MDMGNVGAVPIHCPNFGADVFCYFLFYLWSSFPDRYFTSAGREVLAISNNRELGGIALKTGQKMLSE